mgnify:CR=1 FL=1
MNAEEKYLLRLGFDNPVMNADEYPLNNSQNAEKWLYLSDILREYHAQQSKGMYTEEEVAEAAFNSWTECYKQNRRTDAPYDKAARLYSNQTFEQYWKSIKPKK